jgi:hypothetical protein
MAWKATQHLYFLQYHLPIVMLSYVVKPANVGVPAPPTVKIYVLVHVLTYLLIYSTEQSPSWEASQDIPHILWHPNIHYHIHKCPPPVPILSQSISPGPRLSIWTFHNKIWLYSEELLPPRPNPKLEDHLLLAVHNYLFNIFAATLHIGGRSSICNLKTRHVVVTGTHLSWDIHMLPWRLKQ